MTPSGRCLAHARELGWLADVVERRITKILTKDLFGCIDLVALDGRPGVLGIQATSRSNVSARVRKIQEECWPAAEAWLLAGNRLEVWGWGKMKPRGEKRPRWRLRRVIVTLEGAHEALAPTQSGLRVDLGSGEPPA